MRFLITLLLLGICFPIFGQKGTSFYTNREKSIHFIPIELLLNNLNNSTKQNRKPILISEERISNDLYYYLNLSKINCFSNVSKKEFRKNAIREEFSFSIKNHKNVNEFKSVKKEIAEELDNKNKLILEGRKINRRIKDRIVNYSIPNHVNQTIAITKIPVTYNIDTLTGYIYYSVK
ncbi:MAG: hypothetical protein H0X63_08085, partial [Flavobacteriales bacterium]|nr:hypothetical protein [Flavobacteriales bacterium]